jgi:outer membrane lipoprotein-sorting protein
MGALILPLLGMLLLAQDDTARRVHDLIEKLRSERNEERGAADAELRKLGKDALPLIDAAAKDPDPDVALRLRKIATTLRLPEAAEALRHIEQVLLDASTVRIDFHLETRTLGKDIDVTSRATGSLFIARHDKARLFVVPDKGKEFLLVSDGSSVRRRNEDSLISPQGLTARLARSTARVGICFYGPISPWSQVNFPNEATPEKSTPSDLSVEAGDDGSATLVYTIWIQPKHPGLKVRLTFDTQTFFVKKRTMILAHPQAEITIVEVYDRVQIDPELPEHTFKF